MLSRWVVSRELLAESLTQLPFCLHSHGDESRDPVWQSSMVEEESQVCVRARADRWFEVVRHFPIIHVRHGSYFPRWSCPICPKYTLSQSTRIQGVPIRKMLLHSKVWICAHGCLCHAFVSCVLLVIGAFDLFPWPPPDEMICKCRSNHRTSGHVHCLIKNKNSDQSSPARLPLSKHPNSALSPLVHQAPPPPSPSFHHPTFHVSPFWIHCSSSPTRSSPCTNKRTFCHLSLCQAGRKTPY